MHLIEFVFQQNKGLKKKRLKDSGGWMSEGMQATYKSKTVLIKNIRI
jgi:hypothetical protein